MTCAEVHQFSVDGVWPSLTFTWINYGLSWELLHNNYDKQLWKHLFELYDMQMENKALLVIGACGYSRP